MGWNLGQQVQSRPAAADTSRMSASRQVAEPFAGNDDFWTAVHASIAALLSLVVVAAGWLFFSDWLIVGMLVPATLLIRAAASSRRSSQRTRTSFAGRREWRDAERQAVGLVLIGARRPAA
jgi:Flp pilus assembly protein TadB